MTTNINSLGEGRSVLTQFLLHQETPGRAQRHYGQDTERDWKSGRALKGTPAAYFCQLNPTSKKKVSPGRKQVFTLPAREW